MDDSPQLSSFTYVDSFLAGSCHLCSLDYAVPTTVLEDAEENRILNELCNQLDEYQEQSYLLDPCLESLASPLIEKLRDEILSLSSEALGRIRVQRIARLLYFLTKVRGAKVVVRFFPHEVTDLIHLLSLLSPIDSPSTSNETDPLLSTTWELRFLLLLWLSVCVRLPFDLSRLESGTGERIEQCAERWIRGGSKEREGGIEVLARYYARQDAPLDNLIKKCERELQKDDNLLFSSGLVQTLCIVLKDASPEILDAHFPSLYHLPSFLPSDGKGGAMLGKYRVKMAGRLALMKLGKRSREEDVPEEVEVILGELIEGLSHPDTIVRWSAAKYLSRLTSPLPSDFASTVVESVLSMFEECLEESDRAEHGLQGACFAFGELGRRKLLEGEEEIGRLLRGVMKALLFDKRRNMQTIGASVRDSAAYVLWSLARTLTPTQVQPYAQQLAERLACVAVFDREVSIRRAASAAFQEAVGRWGVFPHGIDVLRKIDFFTVSVRHRAYLDAAPSVAAHIEYRPAILDHLLTTGVTHYDPDIRELSAKALGKVTSLDAENLAESLIRQQLVRLATKDSAKLHGILLSLAALAESIENLEESKREELRSQIFISTVNLLKTPASARLLKTSHLVIFASLLALSNSAPGRGSDLSHPEQSRWIDLLHHAGDHSDDKVHRQAAQAIQRISANRDCSKEIQR
ncbi:Cin1p [Sporobolomyces salmoneus]|uniref:Cin1p n=1 Tax=Sporobolomyces salmoneus TaxID=183962 RepID=UPI00316CC18C